MILDAIEPVDLSNEDAERFANALRSLRRLSVGLGFLYGKVRVAELNLLESIPSEERGKLTFMVWGNDPSLNMVRQDLVECAFHWYAVSLCNFVRAISSIKFGSDRDNRQRYEPLVLGPVISFRNKIAAHFAGMTMNSDDSEAERFASLIAPVAWVNERFEAPAMSIYLRRDGQVSDSTALAPWRLTELHEGLCDRFPLLQNALPTITKRTSAAVAPESSESS